MHTEKKETRHSGFDAPTYGVVYPEGTTLVKGKNGAVNPVFPEGYDKDGNKIEEKTDKNT